MSNTLVVIHLEAGLPDGSWGRSPRELLRKTLATHAFSRARVLSLCPALRPSLELILLPASSSSLFSCTSLLIFLQNGGPLGFRLQRQNLPVVYVGGGGIV